MFWGKVFEDFLGFSFILFFLLLVILWMTEGQGLCSNSILVPFVLTNWGNTSSISFSVLVFERSHLQPLASRVAGCDLWHQAQGRVLGLSEDQGGEGAASAGAEGKPTWERH